MSLEFAFFGGLLSNSARAIECRCASELFNRASCASISFEVLTLLRFDFDFIGGDPAAEAREL